MNNCLSVGFFHLESGKVIWCQFYVAAGVEWFIVPYLCFCNFWCSLVIRPV